MRKGTCRFCLKRFKSENLCLSTMSYPIRINSRYRQREMHFNFTIYLRSESGNKEVPQVCQCCLGKMLTAYGMQPETRDKNKAERAIEI